MDANGDTIGIDEADSAGPDAGAGRGPRVKSGGPCVAAVRCAP